MKKSNLLNAFLFILFIGISVAAYLPGKTYTTCISKEEKELYDKIMAYRKANGLPSIPLSKSLTYVSRTHVNDLMVNRPDKGSCNAHSWSKKGAWKEVCYTADHAKASLMWSKPRELTNFTGNGYEIAVTYGAKITPTIALNSWKGSSGHKSVILNQGTWKKMKWKSIGIGIKDNYACAWFAAEADPDGTPANCN